MLPVFPMPPYVMVFFCGLRRDIFIRFIDIVGIVLTFLIFFSVKLQYNYMDFENVLPNTGGGDL